MSKTQKTNKKQGILKTLNKIQARKAIKEKLRQLLNNKLQGLIVVHLRQTREELVRLYGISWKRKDEKLFPRGGITILINPKKKTVGFSVCSKKDSFSHKKGVKIAYDRLLPFTQIIDAIAGEGIEIPGLLLKVQDFNKTPYAKYESIDEIKTLAMGLIDYYNLAIPLEFIESIPYQIERELNETRKNQ